MTCETILANPIRNYPFATVACFDPTIGDLPRRQLDPARNKRFLERLAEAGVPSMLIGASTGHGHIRTIVELAAWFEEAAAADLDGTIKVALLRPEDGITANVELLTLLKERDYSVVFFRPGTDVLKDAADEEVITQLQPLVIEAARLGFAVGLYSIPDVSGVPLTPAAAVKLVNAPGGSNIVAIKVTEADYDRSTLQFLKQPQLRHLKIVQGWDPHLARALQDGRNNDKTGQPRCGVTSGAMGFAVFQYMHIFEAANRGDWDEVAAAQAAVTTLFAAMQDDPTKFADLQRAKTLMGLGEPLTGTVTDEQVQRVLTALESLPRAADRQRLARSLDLMGDGRCHALLQGLYE